MQRTFTQHIHGVMILDDDFITLGVELTTDMILNM